MGVVAQVVLTRGKKTIQPFKMADADAIKKICDIYDWDGKGQFDMYYLMDVVYASRRRRRRSSAPSTRSSPWSTRPSPPQSAPEPTTTTSSSASSTTRTRTEP